MSASNSSFNFNLSNEIDLPSRGNNTHHQAVSSANNSSCYDDDEVFSTNNSFNTQSLQQQHQSHISSSRHLENGSSLNIDAQALAQLYRNILGNFIKIFCREISSFLNIFFYLKLVMAIPPVTALLQTDVILTIFQRVLVNFSLATMPI